jgi:hypothetical protein
MEGNYNQSYRWAILTLGLRNQKGLEGDEEWQRAPDIAGSVISRREISAMHAKCQHFVNFGDE